MKAGHVEGIFEIKGDAVVIISDAAENAMMLYRLIIDGTTGKLKEEKLIGSLKMNTDKKDSKAVQPTLHVSKDPLSENYAVAMINRFVSDTSKRIEIILYGTNNAETNRAYYSSPVEKYKYLQYVDMAVTGADKVAALIYGYNIKDKNEKEGELIFASLDKGVKAVVINDMNLSNDLVIENGITRYDPQTKRMLILSTAKVNSEAGATKAYLGFIDPVTKNLLTNTVVPGEKLKNKYAEVFGKGSDYTAVPQNMFLNNDGTITVIFEEMESLTEKNITAQSVRNIAVATYDNEVELKSVYFIPVDHYVSGIPVQSFYQSEREIAGQQFLKDNQYKTGLYISDGHNSFVLLNDAEQPANDKITRLKDIKDADAYYYQLAGKGSVPKRQYVFGKPVTKDFRKTAVFSVYDYDKANNLLVILKTEKEDAHPGVKLVWLQP